jgi:hypothetical protein
LSLTSTTLPDPDWLNGAVQPSGSTGMRLGLGTARGTQGSACGGDQGLELLCVRSFLQHCRCALLFLQHPQRSGSAIKLGKRSPMAAIKACVWLLWRLRDCLSISERCLPRSSKPDPCTLSWRVLRAASRPLLFTSMPSQRFPLFAPTLVHFLCVTVSVCDRACV